MGNEVSRSRMKQTDQNVESLRECQVCNEDFSQGYRCPRNLPCSHYLCSQCIGSLIDDKKKKCPFCRIPFKADSVGEIMVNRAILDVLEDREPFIQQKKEILHTADYFTEHAIAASPCHATVGAPLLKATIVPENSEYSASFIPFLKSTTVQEINSLLKSCDEVQKDVVLSFCLVQRRLFNFQSLSKKITEVKARIEEVEESVSRKRNVVENDREKLEFTFKDLKDNKATLESLLKILDLSDTFEEAGATIDGIQKAKNLIEKCASNAKALTQMETQKEEQAILPIHGQLSKILSLELQDEDKLLSKPSYP